MKRILFSGYNGRAVFEGRKTETRRELPRPRRDGQTFIWEEGRIADLIKRARYQVGDSVAVAEPYYAFGYWKKKGKTPKGKPARLFVNESPKGGKFRYFEDPPAKLLKLKNSRRGYRLRNGMFAPRPAIRSVIIIQSVWVEKLADITEAGAIAEGVEKDPETNLYRNYLAPGFPFEFETALESYVSMFEEINGPGSFIPDREIMVYRFRRRGRF